MRSMTMDALDDFPTVPLLLSSRVEGSGRPGSRDKAYLVVLAGVGVGEMFKVDAKRVMVGRGPQADVRLFDDGVSRRHLEIQTEDGKVFARDLGSRNGTYCNGKRIDRVKLHDGDKILVGSTSILRFTYHDAIDEEFQQQMYESVLRDSLTRVFNRRYFVDRLDAELAFSLRHGMPMTLVLFDVDHFKNVNDTFGHAAGDEILAQIAARVGETIRTEDVLARIGGEEFAVICRGIDASHGPLVAERLRHSVAARPFSWSGNTMPCTISVGVVSLPEVPLSDRDQVMAAADAALYAAKRSGRNRVSVTQTGGVDKAERITASIPVP